MDSQLRLTVVLGFGIPYIPYKNVLCLFLVCPSLTLSDIFTIGQDGVCTLESQYRLIMVFRFGFPYIPYQKLLCLFLVCTSLILSGISTLSQEGV